MSRLSRIVLVATAGGVCAASAVAVAATSPWAERADAICRVWQTKAAAALGANTQQPSTPKGMYEFMLKARPFEAGELHALKTITVRRPAAATRALAFASSDLREVDAAIAAYRARRQALFLRDANVWQSDRRASRAFAALGARACE